MHDDAYISADVQRISLMRRALQHIVIGFRELAAVD